MLGWKLTDLVGEMFVLIGIMCVTPGFVSLGTFQNEGLSIVRNRFSPVMYFGKKTNRVVKFGVIAL